MTDTPVVPTTHDVPGKMHVLPKPEQPRPRPAPTGPARSTPAEALASVYEDGMRAGIIAGRAGKDFEDALAEVNALVDDTDTNTTADAIRALASPHNREADHE